MQPVSGQCDERGVVTGVRFLDGRLPSFRLKNVQKSSNLPKNVLSTALGAAHTTPGGEGPQGVGHQA